MKELDHLNVQLSGSNLIEASAGTGKTYAIACLYLRLLIEKNLVPEQILVVTYTEAATEELRDRIRSRIREALDVFDSGESADSFLLGLYNKVSVGSPGIDEARLRLDRALKSFDLAAIFTIHGFCLRALQDNAFECGSLYDTTLVTDQNDLLQEVVDDFWRRSFFSGAAPLLQYSLQNSMSPDNLTVFLKRVTGNPQLQILPSFDPAEITALEDALLLNFAELASVWNEQKVKIRLLLEEDRGLSRAKGAYHPDLLPDLFLSMDKYVAGNNLYNLFNGFNKFCSSGILKGKKPTGLLLVHPFFDLCEKLFGNITMRMLALRSELIRYAGAQLPQRKRQRNVRFFDDLLTDLYASLHGTGGDSLAVNLGKKYQAALIDEFQDTDPVQYEIFRKIYGDGSNPLFLIGDPKQAIYSFRGADIFAYLRASQDLDMDRRYTLTDNFRSAPRLLSALNIVFNSAKSPFVFDEIVYRQVQSGRNEPGNPLIVSDVNSAPLQIWYMTADQDGKACKVSRANKEIPVAVAAEIARLLQKGEEGVALIDGRPVLPEDIAVIVRSHRQAGYVQDALRSQGIPGVMRSDASLFATDEAVAVYTLLSALAAPGDEKKIRAALVTEIIGLSGDEIARLLESECHWEDWLFRFNTYHKVWLERGFMVMVQMLITCEGVRGRLLQRPNGERVLTNLLHCFEILHAAADERRLGAEGLVVWLGEQISGERDNDEYQIRLETDAKAVKIVTIHVSKRLEYPIVFCPFLWGGINSDDEVVTFHKDFDIIKDFGSPEKDKHRIMAQKEALSESLRLMYVALTRAKFRCYLVAGKIVDSTGRNRPETSPVSYLFHASQEVRSSSDPVAALAHEIKSLSYAETVQQLNNMTANNPDSDIAVSPLPSGAPIEARITHSDYTTPLRCRSFSGSIDRSWRVSSFTSFTIGEAGSTELPDRDDMKPCPSLPADFIEAQQSEKDVFSFPRGANAGIFFHKIFETLNFSNKLYDSEDDSILECLGNHGYDSEWLPCIRSLIAHVRTIRLSTQDGSFCLAELTEGSWITELEFFFPLKFISAPVLKTFFDSWAGRSLAVNLAAISQALRFKPAEGMVRGFIDMVFEHNGRYYLIDWKSNHLGNRLEDYNQGALAAVMERNLYPLQYLLYTVALNRYLSLRIKDYDYSTHFGGVVYIFLRGVDSNQGEDFGIFRDCPSAEMINDLTDCLIKAGG